jgi:threonine dehydrogenase-like Zn-dependent dehydrogenase
MTQFAKVPQRILHRIPDHLPFEVAALTEPSCVAFNATCGNARITPGDGFDVVIDAAGVSATLKLAIDIVRPAGQICKVGWGPQPLNFSLDPLVKKAVTLQGSFSQGFEGRAIQGRRHCGEQCRIGFQPV